MPVATLTSKGQMTIPLVVRDSLGVSTGDRIELEPGPDGTWVLSALGLSVDDIAGILPVGGPAPSVQSMDDAMVVAATASYQ